MPPSPQTPINYNTALHQGMMELASANREQAAAMQAAFFGSSQVGGEVQ